MHFVDEDDHIAGGGLINQGYRLYQQISTNHQPLVYLASAAIQKITHPDNIFMLIRRQRQAMFFYGAFWSLVFVWQFSWTGLIFVLFFEFLKYGLLGNLLLAETLASYPAVYLLTTLFSKKSPGFYQLLFWGLGSFLVWFNLAPLWPFLTIIWLVWLRRLKIKILHPLFSFSLLTLLLFLFSPPAAWFNETVLNNWQYAVPALNQVKTLTDQLKIIFFPFLAFSGHGSLQAQFISLFFTVYLLAASFFNRRLLWFYPLLVLVNNRVLSPEAAYYAGFHLLPWLGMLIWIFAQSLKFLPKYLSAAAAFVGLALLLNNSMIYFSRTSPDYEYYVNYSTIDDYNFAVKNLANPGDRLAATNNQPLLYWHTNTRLASRQLVYYSWQSQVAELKADFTRIFDGNNPPEIICGGEEQSLLDDKYVNIARNGQPTELYLRRDKFDSITDSQWTALKTRGFNKE